MRAFRLRRVGEGDFLRCCWLRCARCRRSGCRCEGRHVERLLRCTLVLLLESWQSRPDIRDGGGCWSRRARRGRSSFLLLELLNLDERQAFLVQDLWVSKGSERTLVSRHAADARPEPQTTPHLVVLVQRAPFVAHLRAEGCFSLLDSLSELVEFRLDSCEWRRAGHRSALSRYTKQGDVA